MVYCPPCSSFTSDVVMFFIPVCFLVSWCEASYPILSYAWCVCWLLDCSSFSCVCCMFALLCGPCVPCVLHVLFFEFFLAFGCCTIFAFGLREKPGAWAPDIVAATNAAFRPRWREQLWDQGQGKFFLRKNLHFFLHFRRNP